MIEVHTLKQTVVKTSTIGRLFYCVCPFGTWLGVALAFFFKGMGAVGADVLAIARVLEMIEL